MENAVCFTVDERYLPIALAAASALVEEEARTFDVVILLKGEIDPALKVPAGIQIIPNELEKMIPTGTNVKSPWGKIAYTRIFAPIALADRFRRILYLDADVAIFNPISPLFSLDMKSMALAAVEGMMDESAPLQKIDLKEYKAGLGITDGRAFNSGALLIDSRRWADIDHDQTLSDYAEMRRQRATPATGLYGDQDYLNFAMRGRWLGLSPRWNYQTFLLRYDLEKLIDPAVVHYVGARRPWNPLLFPYAARHKSFYKDRLEQIGFTDRNSLAVRGYLQRYLTDSIRRHLHNLGTPTKRRMFAEWKTMRNAFKNAIQKRIDGNQYEDVVQGISRIDFSSDPLNDVTIDQVSYYRGQIRVADALGADLP